MRPLLLLVKVGRTLPDIAARRGDFEDFFAQASGLASTELHLVQPFEGEDLPSPRGFGGVIVTGSAAMVTDREAWSERTGRWLRATVESGMPVLGVCYGHQLLADAFGGTVAKNPRGREIGSIHVELRPDAARDALFEGMPPVLSVQATHVESVVALPRGAEHLAGNGRDPHQAFRIGEKAWGVQFHPEFDADIVRGYIEGRRARCEEEGIDADALLRDARDSEHGAMILKRFVALVRS